jgi:hypothetical protein
LVATCSSKRIDKRTACDSALQEVAISTRRPMLAIAILCPLSDIQAFENGLRADNVARSRSRLGVFPYFGDPDGQGSQAVGAEIETRRGPP